MQIESQVKFHSSQNIHLGSLAFERLALHHTSCMEPFSRFVLIFYNLKLVPVYFSCFSQCCNIVLLWRSRNVFGPQSFTRLSISTRVSRYWPLFFSFFFFFWVNFSFSFKECQTFGRLTDINRLTSGGLLLLETYLLTMCWIRRK